MNKRLHTSLFTVLLFSSTLFAAAKFPFPQQVSYQNGILPAKVSPKHVQTVYDIWLQNYYTEQGDLARIKFDTPTQTVSEGIGYGMLIMVYMDNAANNTQPKFDKLWNYWKKYPSSGSLMHWKIDGFGSVVESGSATDGDIDAALALVLAYHQWGDEKYLTGAKAMMSAIKQSDVSGNVLDGGDQWNPVNPSYMSTVATQIFQSVDPSGGWSGIQSGCYSSLKGSQNGSTGLWPNWSSGGVGSCPGCYGFDAARTPWRMGWAYVWYGHADAKACCTKIVDWFKSSTGDEPGGIGQDYSASGTPGSSDNIPTFLGPLVVAGMVDAKYQSWVDKGYTRLSSFGASNDNYYNECLELLTMLLLSGNMPDLTTATPKTTASLSVKTIPEGAGTITVSPQKSSYTRGDKVTITVSNSDTSQYSFLGWTGDFEGTATTASVTVAYDMTIMATFEDKGAMDLVDDCEDGNGKTFLKTAWFTFTDVNSNGKSTVTPTSTAKNGFVMTDGGYNSDKAVKIEYTLDKGSFTGNPFVGVGFEFAAKSAPVDISASTGLSFYYKGTFGDTACGVKVESESVTEGGASYNYFLKPSSSWKGITINWSDFTQPKWAKPANLDLKAGTKIQWQIQAGGGSGDLWLDDIHLLGFYIERPLAIYPSAAQNRSSQSNALLVQHTGAAWSIATTVSSEGEAILELYGLNGRRVATLMQNQLTPGTHLYTFSPRNSGVARGSYLLSLVQGRNRISQTVIIDR